VKRGEGVFSPTTQKMVRTKISRLTKKYITSLNTQIVLSYEDNVLYRESKVLKNNALLVLFLNFIGSFLQEFVDSSVNGFVSNLNYVERLL
jgi:hypothetical protein